MRGLAGKVCVIAGGASGIGRGTAIRLAEEGCKVVVGDMHLDGAAETAALASAAGKPQGGEAVPVRFDMADEPSIAALIAAAVDAYGGVDAIHVNANDMAAVREDSDALDVSLDIFDRTIAVGLRGHLVCTRHALPEMLRRGGGSVCYTSSSSAYLGDASSVSYATAKVGLTALARHVARRWGKQRVRANAILPGMVITEHSRLTEEQRAPYVAMTPSHRLGTPADIGAMVAFLFSEDGEWITGQSLAVGGGMLMR